MIINVGDKIRGNRGRVGEIINIGIAVDENDIAAESEDSLNAKTYDTKLGYTGAITYTGENGTYWCYLDQIEENLTTNEKVDKDDIRKESENALNLPQFQKMKIEKSLNDYVKEEAEREESDVDVQLNLELENTLGK